MCPHVGADGGGGDPESWPGGGGEPESWPGGGGEASTPGGGGLDASSPVAPASSSGVEASSPVVSPLPVPLPCDGFAPLPVPPYGPPSGCSSAAPHAIMLA